MSSEYHKIGTTYRTYFLYVDPSTGQEVTGLSAGDFSIDLTKNGTGNQSTTGITIAEVDSTNNPGLYSVTVSGSTGFVSATGVYELTIFRTSDGVEDGHTQTVTVSSDGTGAGSWGDASFTATASDGRVTDGASALQGATVRILDSNNALYVQTTTDASGLWGPVYFSEDGTYTISVQKSGYTLGSDTLTVSGSSATGPGADIELTASGNTSGLLASNLWGYALRQFIDRQGSKADTEKKQIVNDALHWLSLEKDWPWLHRLGVVDLVADYDTGTIAINNADKTVTLTGGTWPSWAANGDLVIDGQMYEIASRTSGSEVELKETWNSASISGESYVIMRYRYTLPTDLLRTDELLFGQTWPWGADAVSDAVLEMYRNTWQFGQSTPNVWSIAKNQLKVWPWPTAARRVNILYYAQPAELTDSADEADWDPMQIVLLRRAIDYQVSLRGNCVAGTKQQCLMQLNEQLASAAPRDKTATDRRLYGPHGLHRSSLFDEDIQTS